MRECLKFLVFEDEEFGVKKITRLFKENIISTVKHENGHVMIRVAWCEQKFLN